MRCRRGIAAVEFALTAPVLVTMMVGMTDLGGAIMARMRIERAVAVAAQYAVKAAQSGLPTSDPTTFKANVKAIAESATSSFLKATGTGTKPNATVVFNNPNATADSATTKCCPGATWTCSPSSGTCSDGTTPYLSVSIKAVYTLNPVFPSGTALILGSTITVQINSIPLTKLSS